MEALKAIAKELQTKYLSESNKSGAPEKHLPVVTVENNTVEVKIPHVMDSEAPHWIEYVWLTNVSKDSIITVQQFQATDSAPPTITATNVESGTVVKAYSYCNLHGLWGGEDITV